MNRGLYTSSLDNFCFIVYNTTLKLHGYSMSNEEIRPFCCNKGCKNKTHKTGDKSRPYRPICGPFHTSYSELGNAEDVWNKDLFKELFEDKGIESCKTGKCCNQDGRLGFSCPIDYEKSPWAIGITELDHIDGNRYNNFAENIQELCRPCHIRKGKINGDLSKQDRYNNVLSFPEKNSKNNSNLNKGGNYV